MLYHVVVVLVSVLVVIGVDLVVHHKQKHKSFHFHL